MRAKMCHWLHQNIVGNATTVVTYSNLQRAEICTQKTCSLRYVLLRM